MKRLFLIVICLTTLFTSYSKSKQKANTPSLFDNVKYELVQAEGPDGGSNPELIKARLEKISGNMEMRYTQEVQDVIDSYLKYNRKQITNLLLRSAYYMPIFEEALKEAGLPEELKYLPIIESGLNPKATSPVGAGGLWQFMPIAAKGYDMAITSTIDERRDPYLSSERACRLLKDLYKRFGDWGLALAGYNAGPGTVLKALKRAGGDPKSHNFWTISSYLPKETRKYVPKFIAMTYLMTYYGEHAIAGVMVQDNLATGVVKVTEKTSLKKMAQELDVKVEDLRLWNPQFKGDVVPGTASRPCNIVVWKETAYAYNVLGGKSENQGNKDAVAENNATKNQNGNKTDEKKEKRDNKMLLSNDKYVNIPSESMPGTAVRTLKLNKMD